jgi:hypothetical protein
MGGKEMPIGKLFRFWTNEMPLAKVIRGLCFRLMLAFVVCASSITMQSHPANAMVADPSAPADEADRFSMECVESCTDMGGDQCESLKLQFDPRAIGVNRFHLKLSFDPTRFKFNPLRSGPLCSFADGGEDGGIPCDSPRPSVKLGKKTEIRVDNTPPGIPPPGSILSYSEPISGHLVVEYSLAKSVDLRTDQTVFELAFDLITPTKRNVRLFATYFGTPPEAQTPGAVRFNQLESSCNGGAIRCLGQPAIAAFDIIPLP